MNDKFKQLYDYLKSNGMTTLDEGKFMAKYSSPTESAKIHNYLKSNGMTDLDANAFHSEYFAPIKKKEPTVSPSTTEKGKSSLATPQTAKPKASASSSSKEDGFYVYSHRPEALYKKEGGRWLIDPNKSGSWVAIDKKDRISLLEAQAKKYIPKSTDATSDIRNIGVVPSDATRVEKTRPLTSVDLHMKKDLGTGVVSEPDFKVFHSTKNNKYYRLEETKDGIKNWYEADSKGNKIKSIVGQDGEQKDPLIKDPTRVSVLNKMFGQSASTSLQEKVYTGLQGKENNQYRVRDGFWERKSEGSDHWYRLTNQSSINILNKKFNENVKVDKSKKNADEILKETLSVFDNKILNELDEEQYVPILRATLEANPMTKGLYEVVESGNGYDAVRLVNKVTGKSTHINVDNWTDERGKIEGDVAKAVVELDSKFRSLDEDKERLRLLMIKPNRTDKDVEDIVNLSGQIKRKSLERTMYTYDMPLLSSALSDKLSKDVKRINRSIYDNSSLFNAKTNIDREIEKLDDKYLAGLILDDEYNDKKRSLEIQASRISTAMNNNAEIATNSQDDLNVIAANRMAVQSQRGNFVSSLMNEVAQGAEGVFRGAVNMSHVVSETSFEDPWEWGTEAATQEYMSGENRSDFSKAIGGLVRSITASAIGGTLGKTGVGASASQKMLNKIGQFSTLALDSQTQMLDEMSTEEFDDVSNSEKYLFATTYGIISGLLEKAGIDNVLSGPLARRTMSMMIKEIPKGASKEVVDQIMRTSVKKAIAYGATKMVGGAVGEGATEFVQEGVGIGMKSLYNAYKKKELFDTPDTFLEALGQMGEAAYLGAIGGGTISGTVSSFKAIGDIKRLGKINRETYEYARITKDDKVMHDVVKTSLKRAVALGKMSTVEAKGIIDEMAESSAVFDKIPEGVSAEQRYEAYNLINEKAQLEKNIDGKDPNLVVKEKERIAEINNTLQNISKADVKQESEVKYSETTDAKAYSEALSEAREELGKDGPGLELQLTEVSEQEAQAILDEGGKILMTDDGKGGAYVKKDGYMGGLFRDPRSVFRNIAKVLQEARVKLGGRFTESYATELEAKYIKNGFRPIARLKFDERYAPEGWDAETSPIKHKPDVVFYVYDPDGKATEGDGQYFNDYSEAYEYAKNYDPKADAKVAPTEVKSQISKAKRAISKILPNIEIIEHTTQESYEKATGSKTSAGNYNEADGKIHINASKANARTVAHEVFHAVLLSKAATDKAAQSLTKRMIDAVKKSIAKMDGGEDIMNFLNEFSSNYEENLQNEEKLAELFGILASEYKTLPPASKNIVSKFLDKIAKMFGLKSMTDAEVIDFMNNLSEKVAYGAEITEKDIKSVPSKPLSVSNLVNRFQANFKDPITGLEFVYDKNTDKWSKLEKEGYITRDKTIEDFHGKHIHIHIPDMAFSGMIYKNGELLVEGKGGVFYPIKYHENGYFWASTDRAANQMANDLNKQLKLNGGKIYLALASSPQEKLFSSTTMSGGFLDFFVSKVFDKTFKLKNKDVANAISLAASATKIVKIKDQKTGKIRDKIVGLKLNLGKVKTVDDVVLKVKRSLSPDNSSFEDRKLFIEALSKEMAKIINKDTKARDEFGKLFSEGINNEFFKGITKTGKYTISATNIRQALGYMFNEPMLRDGKNDTGNIYAVLEIEGPLEPVVANEHESYPKAVKSEKGNKTKLHILSERVPWDSVAKDVDSNNKASVLPTNKGITARAVEINAPKKVNRVRAQEYAAKGNRLFSEPLPEATEIANDYAKKYGINMPKIEKITSLDKVRAKKISDAFDAMEHDPNNPEVKEAYSAMAKETLDQYEMIIGKGYKVTINNTEPYDNSSDMIDDLRNNKNMNIFSTESGFGDDPITDQQRKENPLLKDSGFKDSNGQTLLVNDVFRFVHDFFGHAKLGNSFGPLGEENAWNVHSAMYSDVARKAMTTETRGQNSWVNFSGVNDEVFKIRDKARALRKEGKIEQAKKLTDKVYGQMKFADQKVGLLPDWAIEKNGRVREQKPQKTDAIADAKAKFDIAQKRGGDFDRAVNAAIADLKKNDWYKDADDTQREDAIRELRKELNLKEKKSPSVAKVLGKKKKETKTVNEASALKNQLRLEAKAARDAKLDAKAKVKAMTDAVRKMATTGKITSAQAGVLLNKLGMTNIDNQEMVDRFLEYAEKVFKRADYAERVEEANAIRKSIKKSLKDNQAEVRGMASQFAKVDPSMVEDIDAYIEMANEIKEATRKTTLRGNDLIMKHAVLIERVNEFTEKELERQEEIKKNILLDMYYELVWVGLIDSDMTLEQIRDMISEITNPESKMSSEEKAKIIKDSMIKRFESLALVISNMNTSALIQKFIDMDLSEMDAQDAVKAVEAAQNFVVNGITSGIQAQVSKYDAIMGSKKAAKLNTRGSRLIFSKVFGRVMAEQFATLPVLFDKVFVGSNAALLFKKLSGFDLVQNAIAKASRIHADIIEEYGQRFEGKEPNGEAFNTAKNIYERGMYSFLRRNIIGSDYARKKEFNRRVKLIKDSIENLMRDGDEDQRKMAEIYQELFDKLGLGDPNTTISDVESRVDHVNRQASDWWINKWGEHYSELSDVSLAVYNTQLDQDTEYTPDRISNIDGVSEKITDDMISNSGAFGIDLGMHTDTNIAGVLMESTKPSSISKNKFVNLDFDMSNSNSMRSALIDIHAAAPLVHLGTFLKTDGYKNMIKDRKDRDLLTKRINNYVRRSKGKEAIDSQAMSDFSKVLNALASIGAVKALGSITQPLMQTIPVALNTLINTNGRLELSAITNKDLHDFIDKSGYGVAIRGLESSTVIESANKYLQKAPDTKGQKAYELLMRMNEGWLKVFLSKPDVFIARASWVSYYKASLKKQGLDTNVDWKTHELNKEAANYAEHMVDRQQNVSDASMMGEMMVSNDPRAQIVRKVALPFANFVLNQKNRMYADLSTIYRSEASREDKLAALKSMGGLSIEMITYHTMGYVIRDFIKTIAKDLVGYDVPEDEDKDKESGMIYAVNQIIKDFFSPLPTFDGITLVGFNTIAEKVQSFMISDEDIKSAIDEENKDRKTPMDEYQEREFLKKWKEEKMVKFEDYEDNKLIDLGTISIIFDKFSDMKETINMHIYGEFEKKSNGKTQTRYINKEQQSMLGWASVIDGLHMVGLLPREAHSGVQNVKKYIKRMSITSSQKGKVSEIKNAKQYHEDLAKAVKWEKDKFVDEVKWIESFGNITEEKGQEIVKIIKANKEITADQIRKVLQGQKASQIL